MIVSIVTLKKDVMMIIHFVERKIKCKTKAFTIEKKNQTLYNNCKSLCVNISTQQDQGLWLKRNIKWLLQSHPTTPNHQGGSINIRSENWRLQHLWKENPYIEWQNLEPSYSFLDSSILYIFGVEVSECHYFCIERWCPAKSCEL